MKPSSAFASGSSDVGVAFCHVWISIFRQFAGSDFRLHDLNDSFELWDHAPAFQHKLALNITSGGHFVEEL